MVIKRRTKQNILIGFILTIILVLLMLLVLCMIGAALPCFDTIALLIPQFFPRIGVTIRGLTIKDK